MNYFKEISIVIPVYNAEKYISRCLNSIIGQTYQDFEIILINDGSKDKSLEILKEYSNKYENIKIFSQENSGPSKARNLGIEKANGKYLIFIDIDDWIEINFIKKIYNEVVKGYDLVTIGYKDISKYGIIELNDFKTLNKNKDRFLLNIFDGVGGTLWAKIFKIDIIKKYNLNLNPKIFMCEDQLFVLEYALKINNYSNLKECLYNYNRLNEHSITSKMDSKYYENMKLFLFELRILLNNDLKDKSLKNLIIQKKIESIYLSLLLKTYFNNSSLKEKYKFLKKLSQDQNIKELVSSNRLLINLKENRILKVHLSLLKQKYKRMIKDFIKFKIIRNKKEVD